MDRGKAICQELKKAGIHHIAWLPDTETHFMGSPMLTDSKIRVMKVCREGEAIAICAGLHLGGKRAALLVENQGILECGNILKWAVALETPMLLMVGLVDYRFYMRDTAQGKTRETESPQMKAIRDAIRITEPFLDVFGIKHYLVDSDEDVKKVVPACEEAWRTGKPVALLLTSADEFRAGT